MPSDALERINDVAFDALDEAQPGGDIPIEFHPASPTKLRSLGLRLHPFATPI